MKTLPHIDSCELEDDGPAAPVHAAPVIDTPAKRLEAWAMVCAGGATNVLRVDGVSYSWDTRPRVQKNGAAIGRVYAQRRGELPRDVGMYKLGARGDVLAIPAALAGVLPGAEGAAPASAGEDPQLEVAS